MEKKELQLKTNILLARIQCIDPDRKQYIDWAIEFLLSGIETENLYILAGLEPSDWFAIERYFNSAAAELEINIDTDKTKLLDFYITFSIKEALKTPFKVNKTVKLIQNTILSSSFYRNKNLEWIYCYDEIEELTGIPAEKYALEEFNNFLKELNYENNHTTKTD